MKKSFLQSAPLEKGEATATEEDEQKIQEEREKNRARKTMETSNFQERAWARTGQT